ncbi:hyalin-like [Amphiura filiformis]|uniref:hyalin-like n=1 Tax=Amphiura filiformis TaxID=82378 RepID=UPI003B20D8FF
MMWDEPEATDNSRIQPITAMVTTQLTSGSAFPIGRTIISYTSVDQSGNSANCSFSVIISDAEAPSFSSCPNNQSMNTDLGGRTVVTWNATEAIDNSGEAPTATCNRESGSEFQIGHTKVSCTAYDGSGNNATCEFSITIFDTEPPEFNCPNQSQNTEPNKPFANVTWGDLHASDNSGEMPHITCNRESESQFNIGRTVVSCEAVDESGNYAVCSFIVEISDTEPPELTCRNHSQKIVPNEPFATVTWGDLHASDNSGEMPHITCDHEQGSKFNIGRTVVSCKAEDGSGNNAVCNFTVDIFACNDPLGMENGDIPDGNIQASSSLYPAQGGRLNGVSKWATDLHAASIPPWIQADIGYATNVSAVITQGSGPVGLELWTTSFKVSTFLSTSLNDEVFITDQHGAVVIFPGNVDISSEVITTFPEPVNARIVRITCLDGSDSFYATLRFEILGCKNETRDARN